MPLDPAYPPERLAYMLEDSAPVVVLAQASTRALLGAVPVIDLEQPTWSHQPIDNPQVNAVGAYVIYTSGSTGQPKGVINDHAGVVNRLLWMQDAYGLTAADAVLQKTPFSFDVSVWEFFWPLCTGARLVMARPGGHKDPAYLCEVIEAEQVTTLHFVPSMLDVFLAHGDVTQAAGLVRVMCSGEALPGSLVRRFKQQLPGSELHNLYGPTEAAVDVTAWNCAGAVTPDNTPIGKPIANTRMYVLDGQLQPVPLGVVGELFIGGVQVARGYLNRPELTAERFLKDPFTGARMYRTGDIGRYLPDGTIEYLGRNDDQVKIRGLRIELGEIHARLIDYLGVDETVVIARDERLVAYYTGVRSEIDALRAHLLQHLPEFMVPALFVVSVVVGAVGACQHLPLACAVGVFLYAVLVAAVRPFLGVCHTATEVLWSACVAGCLVALWVVFNDSEGGDGADVYSSQERAAVACLGCALSCRYPFILARALDVVLPRVVSFERVGRRGPASAVSMRRENVAYTADEPPLHLAYYDVIVIRGIV